MSGDACCADSGARPSRVKFEVFLARRLAPEAVAPSDPEGTTQYVIVVLRPRRGVNFELDPI